MSRRGPEVLSPVGGPDCLPAAVAGGADAVFLGLRHFNARGRAENFRKADLPRHVEYLHQHGVKCYVVLNTLVHDDELPKALDLAKAAHGAGVDAAIIQDLGLWSLLTREVPGLPRHASTQMTVHDPSQIHALADLGAERVILARELTLAEVAACTTAAHERGIETEHFVHGALCYAFSGQCLMSNFAGCRSANRGTCAQNCRFDYQVEGRSGVDSEISMRDLSLATRVGELADLGVASLKIEGRLKGPEYVYTTARIYRAAVDAWAAGTKLDPAWVRDLQRDVFSRANTTAPIDGVYDQKSRLHRWDPAQDGAPDATLVSLDRARSEVVLQAPVITAGQGYAFTVGTFNGGFLVTHAERQGAGRWRCRVRLPTHGPAIPAGTGLFRNADHARKVEAAAAMSEVPVPAAVEGLDVRLVVTAAVGAPVSATATVADGRTVTAATEAPCPAASGAPLDEARLRDALGALGGSGFRLESLTATITGSPFCPASVLKDLRRRLVADLAAQPIPEEVPAVTWAPPEPGQPRPRATALWVVVGSLAAAEAARAAGAQRVWLDDPALDLWGPRPPVLPAHDWLWLRHPATAPVSPHLSRLSCGIVAGHLGVLQEAHRAGRAVTADVFLNTYSTETLQALGDQGAEAVVISLECSAREVARLAARCGSLPHAPALALVVHGRLPSMLTRQDHGLPIGGTRRMVAAPHDGGLPYEIIRRHHDTVIAEGRRLCAPTPVAITRGLVDAWVLELNDLAPAAVSAVVSAYGRLLDGSLDPAGLEAAVAAHCPDGIFPGHLERGSRELDAVAGRLADLPSE